MDFNEIDDTYSVVGEAAIQGWVVSEVEWPTFQKFHETLRAFENAVVGAELVESWGPRMGYLKRYRYFLATTPFSPKAMVQEMRRWRVKPGPEASQLLHASPDEVRKAYHALREHFEQLVGEEENPLWKAALEDVEARGGGVVAVLYTEVRLSEPLWKLLEEHDSEDAEFWPVRPTELKGADIYDQLVVFGPTRRHQRDGTEFIFRCPRASATTLFTPAFFPTKIPEAYGLAGSPHRKSGGSLSGYAKPTTLKVGQRTLQEIESPAEPDVDWLKALPILRFAEHPTGGDGGQSGGLEHMPARQVLLSGDHAVFLPAGGGAYRIAEVRSEVEEGMVCKDIEHVDFDDIAPGDVLLFSTGGGGDMVAEVADTIMAEKREWARGWQLRWKIALRREVYEKGYDEVVFRLKRAGSPLASIPNIRNWCSIANIGPGSRTDFEAVLDLCGIEQKEEVFGATAIIREAHRKAGFQLSGKLLRVIEGRSLSELHRSGMQRFGKTKELPNEKTAFLVVAIAPDVVEVSPLALQNPFPVDENRWR